MNLTFDDLDRVARIQAKLSPYSFRQDVYQQCWLRFLTYDPTTVGGAMLMGKHARLDLVVREQYIISHTAPELALTFLADTSEAADRSLTILQARFPEEVEWLLNYYQRRQATPRERTSAFRIREKIKQELGIDG